MTARDPPQRFIADSSLMNALSDRFRESLSGRYLLAEKLGEGATAEVFAARDVATGNEVAVKVLRREVAAEVGAERFVREIQVVRKLVHPNIVPVLDSGTADGSPFHVMPRVRGESLRARMDRETQLPLADVIEIAQQVANALDSAHALGIVHRDIKPENILLDRDRAYVADFGIAFAIDAAAGDRITASGLTVGTPQYMSPEQSSAERKLDGRSDVYSLACVCYEMLAGQPPFTGATTQAIRARHVTEAPASICVVRPSLPQSVDDALQQGLAKSPADRPATAAAFVTLLRRRAGRRAPSAAAWAIGSVALAGVAWLAMVSSPGLPDARRWVLVADFSVPAGEQALGGAIRELVSTSLARSTVVSLVPGDQVAAARANARMPDSTPLDLERAREIAVRTSVRVVVAGAVSRLGENAYSITLHAVNAADGATLFSDARAASDTGVALVNAIQDLTQVLRSRLGERAGDVEATQPLSQVSTPSFEAFREYQDALARSRVGDYEGALTFLRRAVTRDTAFASAWIAMATVFANSQRADSAERAYRRALVHEDRLYVAERDRLRGDIALNVEHDPAAALRWYDAYIAQSPQSVAGHTNRAAVLSALGRHADALSEVEQAIAINPLRVDPKQIALMNVAGELIALGQVDSARRVVPRLRGFPAQHIQLLIYSAAAQWDSLALLAGEMVRNPATPRYARFPATTSEAAAWAALGDTARAALLLERAEASATPADIRWFTSARLLYDRARRARTLWPLPPSIARDTGVEAAYLQGLHAAQAGDLATLHAASRRLSSMTSRQIDRVGHGGVLLAALDALEAGDSAAAVALLSNAAREGEHQPFTTDRAPTYWLRQVLLDAIGGAVTVAEQRELAALAVTGSGIPPVHLPLRGFVWIPGARRIAVLNGASPASGRE